MRRDSRLSVALHVLLHMSEQAGALTSEALAPLLATNPVVLRRTLAGLREAGIVRSVKGHGGGWSIGRDLASVTLGDVYTALGVTNPFGIGHREPRPRCVLEQAVNRALDDALAQAEALLLTQLQSVTVDALLADARRGRATKERSHA